jgi:hypothetical protein
MLPKELNEKFDDFFGSMNENKYLDKKTTRLVFLAATMMGGCDQ